MKKILSYCKPSTVSLLLVAGYCLLLTAFSPGIPGGELQLTISNIYPVEGELYIAVYDNEQDYMDIEKTAFRKIVPVDSETLVVVFENVPYGEYAISVFQDLNGNGELDEKKIGIPAEPFGFSNDARGKLGPPKYKKARFVLDGKLSISLRMVNNAEK
ncbi:MAG: DUF2141 domain-containing protein [Bacteroidales bacterium]|jgi:uncharacterized protein (DUF2141 family)|nr:DUF2141 domain-containing protein [Bacteroidales bacterium]